MYCKSHIRGFLKLGVIGIFVLIKYENELELVTSGISANSVSP